MEKQQQTGRRSNRKMFTVAVLVLVVMAFYIASFFVVSG